MTLGHKPSIGVRGEESLEGKAGRGELRIFLKGTGCLSL